MVCPRRLSPLMTITDSSSFYDRFTSSWSVDFHPSDISQQFTHATAQNYKRAHTIGTNVSLKELHRKKKGIPLSETLVTNISVPKFFLRLYNVPQFHSWNPKYGCVNTGFSSFAQCKNNHVHWGFKNKNVSRHRSRFLKAHVAHCIEKMRMKHQMNKCNIPNLHDLRLVVTDYYEFPFCKAT